MAKEVKTIGVLTSGGDAPGMNAGSMEDAQCGAITMAARILI